MICVTQTSNYHQFLNINPSNRIWEKIKLTYKMLGTIATISPRGLQKINYHFIPQDPLPTVLQQDKLFLPVWF